MTRLRVLLVGRRRVFLDAVALWLREVADVDLVADVTDPDGMTDPPDVDVALLDLRLPPSDILETREALRAANPAVALVALSEGPLDHRATPVMTAGFTGWITESDSCDDVLAALRAVHEGHIRVPAQLLIRAVQHLDSDERLPGAQRRVLGALTVREREVLDLLADGLGKEAIAALLCISPHTVRTHQQHVLGKLRVHSTLAAVSVLHTAQKGQPPLTLVPGERSDPG
jgi:DNA-binding NarL/FixJ family response regulator